MNQKLQIAVFIDSITIKRLLIKHQ